MKAKRGGMLITILGLAMAGMFMATPFVVGEEVPRMAKENLKGILDDPNVVVLDVRRSKDWNRSERKIKGAIRENPKLFDSWADKYSKDKTLVLYCA
jgi:hypothetical protein